MKLRIVYCEEKNRKLTNLQNRFSMSFEDAIKEIESGDFLVIDSPSQNYLGQKSFLIEKNKYPVIVPFKVRRQTIQLITMFPDRRYKNVKL